MIGPKDSEELLEKITLNKSIAAQKLSRTGVPTSGPEVTVPFGAIIELGDRDRGFATFRYLTEMYRCPADVLGSATDTGTAEEAKPRPIMAAAAPAVAGLLQFEKVSSNWGAPRRAKVPGGWLVAVESAGLTFYPDPEYRWSLGE
jgi:hypothetical protein